jgi:hypothetical protein
MRVWALGLLAAMTVSMGVVVAGVGATESCVDKMVRDMSWDVGPDGNVVPPADQALDALPAVQPPGGNDTHPCNTRIQPGATMGFCTMNFIFRNPNTGELYFGSAGHCLSVGQVVNIQNVGAAGVTVFSTNGAAPDFSLVRVYPSMYGFVDATMCHWGGPNGVNNDPQLGQTTHIYGYGNIYGASSITRPRPGVVATASPQEITYIGFAQPGDSGSPVETGDGKAAGVHVRSSLSLGSLRVDPSPKYMTRVDAGMAQASATLGIPLELVTSNVPFNLLGY